MNLRRAALAVFLSWAATALVLCVAFLQAIGSAAYAFTLGLTMFGALVQGTILWGAGGLIAHTIGDLDTRAFELTAWSWTPLFFTCLVMLPAAIIAPVFALIVGIPTGLIWHLTVLRKGLEWFDARRPLLVILAYVTLIYLLPLGVAGFLVSRYAPPA